MAPKIMTTNAIESKPPCRFIDLDALSRAHASFEVLQMLSQNAARCQMDSRNYATRFLCRIKFVIVPVHNLAWMAGSVKVSVIQTTLHYSVSLGSGLL